MDRKRQRITSLVLFLVGLLALVGRVGAEPPVVLTGGVARNPCVRVLLERRLGVPLFVPDEPQIVVALGAARSAESAT